MDFIAKKRQTERFSPKRFYRRAYELSTWTRNMHRPRYNLFRWQRRWNLFGPGRTDNLRPVEKGCSVTPTRARKLIGRSTPLSESVRASEGVCFSFSFLIKSPTLQPFVGNKKVVAAHMEIVVATVQPFIMPRKGSTVEHAKHSSTGTTFLQNEKGFTVTLNHHADWRGRRFYRHAHAGCSESTTEKTTITTLQPFTKRFERCARWQTRSSDGTTFSGTSTGTTFPVTGTLKPFHNRTPHPRR